ncbi:hypothetical protein FRC09_017783 [Ceratobasidium sp. 395]|nr:hypothetical protein FRC09_017783 [Ceratobasidium sp. 395]
MTHLDRNLRSGRRYDPLIVPPAAKRRTRKGSNGKKTKAKGNENSSDAVEQPLMLGRLREGIGMSPHMYRQIYRRPPPIRAPKRQMESARESDSRENADASLSNGDAASIVESMVLDARVITPPMAVLGDSNTLDLSDEDDSIFVAAGTSRTLSDGAFAAMSTSSFIA